MFLLDILHHSNLPKHDGSKVRDFTTSSIKLGIKKSHVLSMWLKLKYVLLSIVLLVSHTVLCHCFNHF